MRNYVQGRGIRPAIHRFDANAKILGRGLAIFDKHIEIAVLSKMPVSRSSNSNPRPPRFLFSSNSHSYGYVRLRILVEVLHVRMRWSAVEIEVVFLRVFAMIAFAGVKPKIRSFRIGSLPFQRARLNTSS